MTAPQKINANELLEHALDLLLGRGIEPDREVAKNMLTNLALAGHPEAAWRLCCVHYVNFDETGHQSDFEASERWLKTAASASHSDAKSLLSKLTERQRKSRVFGAMPLAEADHQRSRLN